MLHNFSLWCDFIERSFLEKSFADLIEQGIVKGATSNPVIFKSALVQTAYQTQIQSLKNKGHMPKEIYETLAIEDIQRAADSLDIVHKRNKQDGFVSLEIDPFLANKSEESVEEGERLFGLIERKNVMIKVPTTSAGYEVIEELVGRGIPVNATLVFSLSQTKRCIKAYKKGLESYRRNNSSTSIPQAVISVFVSRFDRVADEILARKNMPIGLLGIRNAEMCYSAVVESNCEGLRTLFASTGVKNKDKFPPYYYIAGLLHSNAINTAPLETIEAFREHLLQNTSLPFMSVLQSQQSSSILLPNAMDKYFASMQKAGIDVGQIADNLLQKGLEDFQKAFSEILDYLK